MEAAALFRSKAEAPLHSGQPYLVLYMSSPRCSTEQTKAAETLPESYLIPAAVPLSCWATPVVTPGKWLMTSY